MHRRFVAAFVLIPLFASFGCNFNQPSNPSFALDVDHAKRALDEMIDHPHPLKRPLLIVGGFWDFNVFPPLYKSRFERLTGDSHIVTASIGSCGSFDECRQAILDAVDEAFPSDDPNFTTEVDVIGASLGGLAARYAAAPSDDPAKPRRLRIARLFTIASPLSGATLAQSVALTQFHRDMRPGSAFLESLAQTDAQAEYEIYPYVRLGDEIVGEQYAAPPHRSPFWLPNRPLEFAHAGAMLDPRILADIARRLRYEQPYSKLPPEPLPRVSDLN